MRILYPVNQYPTVSYSSIRREILALEAHGISIDRVSVRGWDVPLADPADKAERAKTHFILREGFMRLTRAFLRTALTQPRSFQKALWLTVRRASRSDRSLIHHFAYLVEACHVTGFAKRAGTTHVHAHFGTNPAKVAMLVRALGGPPYSFTVHEPKEWDRGRYLGFAEKVARAKFVAAISSFTSSHLFRYRSPADWPKILIVHCGLGTAFIDAKASPPPLNDRFVCVRRLCPEKGQLLWLEAVRQLCADNVNVHMVFAGDGPMRGDQEAAIAKAGMEANCTITGWISSEQVKAEIRNARALVSASFQEGLPVVIMEAMALGRPVITTTIAGIPELVADGDTGWLIKAGSSQGLAEAMKSCLAHDEQVLSAMGERGRNRVRTRHDITEEAAKLATLFRTSLSGNAIVEWEPMTTGMTEGMAEPPSDECLTHETAIANPAAAE